VKKSRIKFARATFKILKVLALSSIIVLAHGSLNIPAFAEQNVWLMGASNQSQTMKITKAKPKTVRSPVSFAEIVVGDPQIASVSPLTDRSFYVVGKENGTTGIALYDAQANLVGVVDVEVGANTSHLNTALKSALPSSKLSATTSNGSLVLEGEAQSPAAAAKARALAKKYDEEIIDTVKVHGSQQVKLEVRFLEARRNIDKELGVRFEGLRLTNSSASTAITGLTSLAGGVPFGQFFTNIVEGGTDVSILVQALEERGLVRSLASPNLVALSGDTASFLAGGEFPIPVSQDENTITVEFKQFGVGLAFTPTILEDGIINLRLAPEVSELDETASITLGNGLNIPGLSVRRAETTLELRDGQSFVLGGLLQKSSSFNKRQLPGIADIPILGALFRSSAYRKNETDLVIIVTPRLVRPLAPGENPATPLDDTAPASDVDFFVNGDLEVKRGHLRQLAEERAGILKSGHIISLD